MFDGGVDTVEFSCEKRNEMLFQPRKMMGEEVTEELSDYEAIPGESIPEDTPLIRLDPKTGEVTMKFKLPGF